MNGMPPVQPIQPAMPQYPSAGTPGMSGTPGMPMVQQVQAPPVGPKKDAVGLAKTIVIIILALIAVTFIGLFIWMMMEKDDVQRDVNGQISVKVAEAKDQQAMELESEFLEREKYPYKTFSGPVHFQKMKSDRWQKILGFRWQINQTVRISVLFQTEIMRLILKKMPMLKSSRGIS